MKAKLILLITTLMILSACASSGTPSVKARNDYSNQVYGRISYDYNLSK